MKKLLNNSELQTVSLDEIRSAIRRGFFNEHTSGLAKGKLQGNLMVLPKDFAEDFMRFCLANSKPCPLIAIGDVGSPLLPSLGIDLDIRTDVPAYNVYRDGQYSESLSDITDLWSDDWVAFVLGCSFTFEAALDAAKVPLRHLNNNKNVSMYRTTVKTVSEGMFEADLVVSMRPIPKHQKQLYSESLKARIFCEYFVDILCWMDSVLVMIRPNFLSAEDRLQLEGCVRRQREDHGIARRANAVLLLDDGESCTQIAKFLYLDDDTIRGWYKAEDGWDALAIDGWQGGKSRITLDQEAELCTWLEGRFCRSAGEIRAYIKSRFGPSYSHSGCLKLLRRLGFEYRKPKALPHVADEIKQAEFIAFYEALMNNLPADETVYFADAVHPEHQTKPAFGWVRKGSNPAVKTTTGRGRVNIHGAVCLENFDAPFVEPITVDGNSAVQLLAKIEANNPTMSAIHVIWDNAAYHRCDAVKKWLARPECRIRLIQLPVYCPHLNPIERLWAVMHAHVTHNHFYATQKQFAEAILHFFREIIPKNWRSFRDQVTDNFRIISHQNFRILE